MSDIYPQSPEDSMKTLSDMHPLSQRLKALEQELEYANARVIDLESSIQDALKQNDQLTRALKLEQELKENLRQERSAHDQLAEEFQREKEYHRITQRNLKQVAAENAILKGQLAAARGVLNIPLASEASHA